MSDLLEAIDAHVPPAVSSDPPTLSALDTALEEAASALTLMTESSEPVLDDVRVQHRRELMLATWAELAPMGRDKLDGRATPVVEDAPSPTSASLPHSSSDRSLLSPSSAAVSPVQDRRKSRIPSSSSSNARSRVSSMTSLASHAPSTAVRRSASRASLRSVDENLLPSASSSRHGGKSGFGTLTLPTISSAKRAASSGSRTPLVSPSKPRSASASVVASGGSGGARRTSFAGGASSRAPAPRLNYRPNLKQKLDVEVARVVNALPVRQRCVVELTLTA